MNLQEFSVTRSHMISKSSFRQTDPINGDKHVQAVKSQDLRSSPDLDRQNRLIVTNMFRLLSVRARFLVGLLFGFYDISTLEGYLMPNPFLYK